MGRDEADSLVLSSINIQSISVEISLIIVLSSIKHQVFGEDPVVPDVVAAQRAGENPAPFSASFANASPRAMTLTDVQTGERVAVAAGAAVERQAARGQFFDWTDAATGELLYRSVIERHGLLRRG